VIFCGAVVLVAVFSGVVAVVLSAEFELEPVF